MSMSQDMKTTEVIARLQEDLTPRELYRLYQALENVVREAEYPRLEVSTDEEGVIVLVDPDTTDETRPVAVDTSERWTYPEDTFYDGDDTMVYYNYDGCGEYHGLVYLSSATGQPVRLPEGWTEESL